MQLRKPSCSKKLSQQINRNIHFEQQPKIYIFKTGSDKKGCWKAWARAHHPPRPLIWRRSQPLRHNPVQLYSRLSEISSNEVWTFEKKEDVTDAFTLQGAVHRYPVGILKGRGLFQPYEKVTSKQALQSWEPLGSHWGQGTGPGLKALLGTSVTRDLGQMNVS